MHGSSREEESNGRCGLLHKFARAGCYACADSRPEGLLPTAHYTNFHPWMVSMRCQRSMHLEVG